MTDEVVEAKNIPCANQDRKKVLVDEEFKHTRKRLSRGGVAPLVQFTVFAYNCDKKYHEGTEGNPFHIDFSSVGSDVVVPNGLQASIAAVEQLLAALKAKLQ